MADKDTRSAPPEAATVAALNAALRRIAALEAKADEVDQVVPCPQCGTAMTLRPAPPEREIAKAMIDHNSQHHYAGNYAARVHEKQAAVGVVAQCPACRYTTRVKDAA